MGLVIPARKYSPEPLEQACLQVRQHRAMTYKSIANVLSKALDNAPLPEGDAYTQQCCH